MSKHKKQVRAYTVDVTKHVVVLATSQQEARAIAKDSIRNGDIMPDTDDKNTTIDVGWPRSLLTDCDYLDSSVLAVEPVLGRDPSAEVEQYSHTTLREAVKMAKKEVRDAEKAAEKKQLERERAAAKKEKAEAAKKAKAEAKQVKPTKEAPLPTEEPVVPPPVNTDNEQSPGGNYTDN